MKKSTKISDKELVVWEFIRTHQCVLSDDGKLTFVGLLREPLSTKASIYLWLSPVEDKQYEVLYVGKAGFGVSKRLKEHKNGFINSNTGKKNKVKIIEKLKTSVIYVYTRICPIQEVFGVNVSTYSMEEEAFCIAYDPLWNRQRFLCPLPH